MADECAIELAVRHADWSSAAPSASSGVRRTLPRPLTSSASDPGLARGGRPQLSCPNETTVSTPRVESIVRSLRVRLGGDSDIAAIAAEVEAEFSSYANARVTQFIPILVERRVWERLRPHVSA